MTIYATKQPKEYNPFDNSTIRRPIVPYVLYPNSSYDDDDDDDDDDVDEAEEDDDSIDNSIIRSNDNLLKYANDSIDIIDIIPPALAMAPHNPIHPAPFFYFERFFLIRFLFSR